MFVQVRVEEWLRKMGYDGTIPASLSKICNPSTAFIWEQLITNAKPRQEVEHKRKTIIANRLSQKPLEQQDQFSYPIKEIEVYMKKLKCEKYMKYLEKETEEKEGTIDKALEKNKVLYVAINNVKARMKEIREKTFLLDKKSKLNGEDIQRAQEVLTLARNLTPVEMEASANLDEITQTLQKCAEKLQKLSDAISMPKVKTNRSQGSSTKSLKHSKRSTFSQCLNQSTALADIVPSCKKSFVRNKENGHHNTMVNKCLKFSDDMVVNKNNKDEKKQKRESLGLLPDDCINTSEEVDAFLLSPSRILEQMSDSIFETPINTNYDILEKLRGDKFVKDILKDLLHNNNRYLIVSQCRNIYEKVLKEIRVQIMECNKLISLDRNIDQADTTQLYFIHVKTELEKEKLQIISKKLQETVKKRKEDILSLLGSKSRNKDEVIKIFELQIEEAFLSGANIFLRKEIKSSQNVESGNELPMINAKIKQLKEEIVTKCSCIESLISDTSKVIEDIKHNREETQMCVKKLGPYIHDERWANLMTQGDHSEEINLFKKFPLEYNRKLKFNNVKVFHRDVGDTTIPSYIKLESNDLELLTKLIDVPFATSENVIFDFLQTRISSNMLKQSETESSDADYHKYTLDELLQKEDFVEPVITQLKSIITSSEVREVLEGPNRMKEEMTLRVEMPYRNFVSEKRQVDGHDYKFYENVLKKLKNK